MSLPRVHTLDLDPAHCDTCRAIAERLGAIPEQIGQPADWPPEPSITINEQQLTMAQAMIVRVGMAAFLMLLEDPEHRDDFGAVGEAYLARTGEVLRILHRHFENYAPAPAKQPLTQQGGNQMAPPTGICATCEHPSVTTLPIKLALQAATQDLAYATSRLPFCQDCLDLISNPALDGTERVMGLALQAAALRLHTRVTNDLFSGNHTMAGLARRRQRDAELDAVIEP